MLFRSRLIHICLREEQIEDQRPTQCLKDLGPRQRRSSLSSVRDYDLSWNHPCVSCVDVGRELNLDLPNEIGNAGAHNSQLGRSPTGIDLASLGNARRATSSGHQSPLLSAFTHSRGHPPTPAGIHPLKWANTRFARMEFLPTRGTERGRLLRLQNPFAGVNTTGLDSQVLLVLAGADQYLTVREIHRMLPEGGSLEGVRKAVHRLVDQGTILVMFVGRSAGYTLNREHLLAEPILQIADAKQELVRRLSREISKWEVQPLTVKLFGSAARGDMEDESDVDLLVVLPDEISFDEGFTLVDELTSRASRWTGNDVRPLLYRAEEVAAAPIFTTVLEEGIDVAGDPSWLPRRLRSLRSGLVHADAKH